MIGVMMIEVVILKLFLLLISILLVISYDDNSTCIVSDSDDICKDIILMGRYIHAGRVVAICY